MRAVTFTIFRKTVDEEENEEEVDELTYLQVLFNEIWLLCSPSDRPAIATPLLLEHNL